MEDLETTLAAAVECGARTVSRPAPARQPGIRFAYLTDPEGNLVNLLEPTR